MVLLHTRLALLGLVGLVFNLVLAHPTLWNTARGLPEDPNNDPFYQPPTGFKDEAPGAVLRKRSVIASFFGLVPDPVEAHQLLYRTTAINGSAISSVTTIFKPLNAKKDRFVSFQTAYDSSSPSCNPSYQYQLGSPQTDLISSLEMIIIQAYLLQGYIVASSDYEGPDAAFGAGRLEATGVLDGMRAVTHYREELGLSTSSPKVVGVGYSGGAIASGWAAGLQPSYAPELDIKGWVMGGTPANLTGTMLLIDDSPFSGFLPVAIAGLMKPSAYGESLDHVIDSIITDYGREKLHAAKTQCTPADILSFFDESIFSTDVQKLGDKLLEEPTVSHVLAENTMGTKKNETPTAPVFMYHATDDEIIPYADATVLKDSWCDQNVDVQFMTHGNGGHVTAEVVGLPDALRFVEKAFAGETESGCSENSILDNKLDPLALGVSLEPVLVKLIDVLAKVGHKDEKIMKNVKVLQETV